MFKSQSIRNLVLFGFLVLGFIVAPLLLAQQRNQSQTEFASQTSIGKKDTTGKGKKLETVNFGAGCFWCVEAVFQQVKGVSSVESGYMGGSVANPTYDAVCSGTTGHAEICQVKFDPAIVSFPELLEVFFKTHDPTTLNRQGADTGTQYRSAIFYTTDKQKEQAQEIKKRLDKAGAFNSPIVTEITKASAFYGAGDYHADYYRRNPNAGYCQYVIVPKLEKFKKVFADKLKERPGK